jgi:predicted transcriptional regulator
MLRVNLLLIENDSPHPIFKISGKGRDFLRAYEDLKALMKQTTSPQFMSKYS